MSRDYEGPIEITQGAVHIPGRARLYAETSGPLKSWGGLIYLEAGDTDELRGLEEATLETPEGEGRAMLSRIDPGDTFTEVSGMGVPPWNIKR